MSHFKQIRSQVVVVRPVICCGALTFLKGAQARGRTWDVFGLRLFSLSKKINENQKDPRFAPRPGHL